MKHRESLTDAQVAGLRQAIADALRDLAAHPRDALAAADALGAIIDAEDRAAFEASWRAPPRADV